MNEETTNTETVETTTNYYDEYFTPTDNGLNGEFNNINVGCITSNNDKFSLDSEGNLIVNSITTVSETSSDQTINFDQIYPIGSIYMNVGEVNPATLFGGTWEKIEGKFLIGANSNYVLGSPGGDTKHKHTVGAHTHNLGDSGFACVDFSAQYINTREVSGVSYSQNLRKTISGAVASKSETRTYGTALGGKTGAMTAVPQTSETTILPPYLPVNMWKRVS